MSSTKFGFRPRALDVSRKLPIRIRKCRKRSAKIKRAVALAPTGMEKEEEMESHLQQALLAQKATSSGDTVENHVIPTPKVLSLKEDEYDRIYQQQRRFQRSKKLISFREYVPFFLTQGSYNADSEDEEWLNGRRNYINVDDFEHIIEKLESASHLDIVKPKSARALLQQYDPGSVDDVYDYWLQKRQKAASKKSKCPVLMPRVCSEVKREEKSIVNPYIAFRRRLDKVQTRKKQKTEMLTYEKMLQINFAMKRSIVLVSALTQRERLKRSSCEVDYAMFKLQYKKRLSNEEVDALVDDANKLDGRLEERRLSQTMEAAVSSGQLSVRDFELPAELKLKKSSVDLTGRSVPLQEDKALERNLELWNAAALITPVYATPSVSDDSTEVERLAAVEQNSTIDGRYQFKRKHGCHYRAALPSGYNQPAVQFPSTPSFEQLEPFRCLSAKYIDEVEQPDGSFGRRVSFAGRRVGRGGRIIIDLISPEKQSEPPINSSSSRSRDDLVQRRI